MTPDQIIQWARAAGAGVDQTGFGPVISFSGPQLTRFAQLVASHKQEQCAKVCDEFSAKTLAAQSGQSDELPNVMLRQIAYLGFDRTSAAIRALKD